jgi:hypothetical protein
MNNLPKEPAVILNKYGKALPTYVVNAQVTDGGVLQKRRGYVAVTGAPGMHSLWAGSVMLAVRWSDNVLVRIDGTMVTELAEVPGPAQTLHYEEVDDLIYIANEFWRQVYRISDGSLRSWGVDLPSAPRITTEDGDLPPGTYTLAYTRMENDLLSGNGPLTQVSWEGMSRGIRLQNLPTDGQCWMTHANGKQLLLAQVEGGTVQGSMPYAVPLLSFMAAPPPNFLDFCYAFGRMWGIRGKKLHYSFPRYIEWFRSSDYKLFLEPLVMLAAANTGIFVSSAKSTWFLNGTDPGKMEVSRVGDGAIPGTLAYAMMPASLAGGAATSASFATMSQMPTPVWMSPTGFVVGTHTGHLTLITAHKLWLTGRARGASFYQMREGMPQLIVSLCGESVSDDGDSDLQKIFEQGRLL